MKSWATIIFAVLASAASTSLAVRAVGTTTPTNIGPQRAIALRKLHAFCYEVKATVDGTAHDMESLDPAKQKRALNRTYSDWELYSDHEIQLCLGSKPDLVELAKCRYDENYPCLARLERRVARALYVPPLQDP